LVLNFCIFLKFGMSLSFPMVNEMGILPRKFNINCTLPAAFQLFSDCQNIFWKDPFHSTTLKDSMRTGSFSPP
jgi:hypothetical protein